MRFWIWMQGVTNVVFQVHWQVKLVHGVLNVKKPFLS